jgi:predicted protein tyrosine phosphatase
MGTWWIDKPLFLGSSNPSDQTVEALYRDGFRVLVSLLQEDKQAPRYDAAKAVALGYKRHTFPVADFQAPSTEQLRGFIDLLPSFAHGDKVVVHCEGGSGRTGTFAAAYWIAKGASVSDAITKVRELRPHAVETSAQEIRLGEFAMAEAVELLVDALALVYHEARNVRHLVHAHAIAATGWEKVVAFPKNRVDAWKHIQSLRMAARRKCTAKEAAMCFEECFGRSLVDLRTLFADPTWKHAKGYGGNAWRGVTSLVLNLQGAITQGEDGAIQDARRQLIAANHNNGTLRDKIVNSDRAVDARTADWWNAVK